MDKSLEIGDVLIPKIIMQTWKSTEIPEKWKKSPESINMYMPDWKYVLMTDQDNRNFVQKYFPDFLSVYDSYEYPIQRADVIRYMWLYINGGIYIDLDYELNTSLEHLFKEGNGIYFVNSPNFPQFWSNSILASRKKHPFWLEVIEKLKQTGNRAPIWAFGKHLKVMETSGPGIFSKLVQETTHQYSVIPVRLISPRSICDHKGSKTGLVEPLEGCSWGSWDTISMNWIFCNMSKFIFISFLLLLFLTLFLYRRYKNLEREYFLYIENTKLTIKCNSDKKCHI